MWMEINTDALETIECKKLTVIIMYEHRCLKRITQQKESRPKMNWKTEVNIPLKNKSLEYD